MESYVVEAQMFSGRMLSLPDRTAAFCEILKAKRELSQLKAKHEERTQVLESLKERLKELHEDINERQEHEADILLKMEDRNDAVDEAEREREELLQREAHIARLKEEYAELTERKKELERQVQRLSGCKGFMERVVKITKFEDVEVFTDYIESLLHFREQFYQKEITAQDEVDQQRKTLLTLESQHNLLVMQKNNLLSQLQTELERTRSEAAIWERKWNHIQETAAQKTLQLGQIKIATLNLYEMTGEEVGGEDGVDMNDTETQLDQLKMFMEDENDIVKQYQTRLQRASDGRKPNKAKKNTKPRKKLTR